MGESCMALVEDSETKSTEAKVTVGNTNEWEGVDWYTFQNLLIKPRLFNH